MKRDLALLTASQVFSEIAKSFLDIFGIIFFYNALGHSILLAALPFALYHFLQALLLPLFGHIVNRLGGKESVLAALTIYCCAALMAFQFSQTQQWFLLVIWAVLYCLGNLLYYVPVITLIGAQTNHATRGRIFSLRYIILLSCSMFSPFIGGIVSQGYGLAGLMLVSIIAYIAAAYPILMISYQPLNYQGNLRRIFKLVNAKRITGIALVDTITDDISNYWPLFLVVLTGTSMLTLGIFITVVYIIGALIAFMIGKIMDSRGRMGVLRVVNLTSPLTWIARAATFNYASALFSDIFYRLNRIIRDDVVEVVHYDVMNDGVEEQNKVGLVIIREAATNYAISFMYLFGAICITLFGFQATFLISAALCLALFYFLRTRILKKKE